MSHISIRAYRYKAMVLLTLTTLFAALLLFSAIGQASATSASRPSAADGTEQAQASQYLSSLNSTRAANGLAPLTMNGTFSAGAQNHAEAMGAANRLSHAGDVNSRCSDVGGWALCAENVAMNTLGSDSVSRAASQFLNSSGHRANIMNPSFDTVGIGVEHANGSFWIVVRFMDLTGVANAPAPANAAAPKSSPKPSAPQTTAVTSAPPVQTPAVVASTKPARLSWLAVNSIMFDAHNKCRICVENLEFVEDKKDN